jgi:hypothetical protein
LPQYGFLARAPVEGGQVEACLCRRQGRIVEMAQSPQELYVNGRLVVELRPIRVSVENFQPLDGGRFEMRLRWQADEPIPAGWRPFLHFCNAEGDIVFQAGHEGGDFTKEQLGTIAAKAFGQIPADAPAGTQWELRAGLYDPQSGRRLWILGPNDGQHRIRLGLLRLQEAADGGPGKTGQTAGQPESPLAAGKSDGRADKPAPAPARSALQLRWTPLPAEEDPVLARMNPEAKPIDFGPVVTAGGVRLHPEDQALLITPLPDADRPFDVVVRWSKLPWKLPRPEILEHLDMDGRVLTKRRLQPAETQEEILLHCSPGIFAYRFRPKRDSD